jgi:2'-5' RNA ligase
MPLPVGTVSEILSWMEPLGARFPGLRWVKPSQLHLTLRFLGDVPAEALERVREIASGLEVAAPVPFLIDRTGSFGGGGGRLPSVYWLGGDFGPGAREASAAFAEVPDEKGLRGPGGRFTPHVTLARQGRCDREARFPAAGPWRGFLDRIVVYNSTLLPEGPRYEELSVRGLGPAGKAD